EDNDGNLYLLGSFQTHKNITTDNTHSIYLSKNNQLIGAIDLKDEIRPGAREIIKLLKKDEIFPVILSGDNQFRCQEIGDELGIKEIYSSKLPHEKTEIIRELKKRGNLLMVGDGINDAPSLVTADIGLSFGEATQIAVNSAQVILINNNDLTSIMSAIRIGKMTMQTIRQNLFWAFFYNIVAVPIAAIGLLSPMVAALSMAFSDVVVIGNSIRLKFRN
ncbi:MAG TPA: HAD-IC family P-type ATPase, partial [Bacteroidia bacterium]|nr:HAD-IC family P-type ATPase [Bacteroidia bacterium]